MNLPAARGRALPITEGNNQARREPSDRSVALPVPRTADAAYRASRWPRWMERRDQQFALLFIGILLAGLLALHGRARPTSRADLETWTVRAGPLDRAIVIRGDLDVATSSDIVCQVKSRNHGSRYSTSIKWVIESGTPVQRGQLLVELDDSALVDELHGQQSLLEQDHAAWVQAEENAKILASESLSAIQAAADAIPLAKLDRQNYQHGVYEPKCQELESQLSLAESDLALWQKHAAFAERLVQQGLLAASQVYNDRSHLVSARYSLDSLQEERRVLKQYAHPQTTTELASKLQQALRTLECTRQQAQAKKSQADVDRLSKQRIYQIRLQQCAEIENQISKCLLTAPHDGLVVYPPPDLSRGPMQAVIAQGESVREGQLLLRLPDLSRMQVRLGIHEALVGRVRAGQRASIQVAAFPERVLPGYVQHVAAFATQPDWWSADVPVYPAVIALEEVVEGLKVGMSATVTIPDAAAGRPVLTVPLQALVGSPALGKQHQCVVLTPQGPKVRDILVGDHNETTAAIVSGLEEGEEVVLNPRALLGKGGPSSSEGR